MQNPSIKIILKCIGLSDIYLTEAERGSTTASYVTSLHTFRMRLPLCNVTVVVVRDATDAPSAT